MKIYNNTNITYSAIEHNSRKNTKQNVPADLEKKMTQYKENDTVYRYTFHFQNRAGELSTFIFCQFYGLSEPF